MSLSKRARKAVARQQGRNKVGDKIIITRRADGTFDIESPFAGPVSTLVVLRQAIQAIENSAVQAEAQAARGVQPARGIDLSRLGGRNGG